MYKHKIRKEYGLEYAEMASDAQKSINQSIMSIMQSVNQPTKLGQS